MEIKWSISILLMLIAQLRNTNAISCIKCDRDAPKCVTAPGDITGSCTGETCYTYVDVETGGTIRGCTSPKDGCTTANNCDSCTTDRCNSDIFPADRGSCIQCNSTIDCITPSSSAKGELCQTYSKDHECFTYVESDQRVIRGCMADGFNQCKDDNCQKCTTNDCNTAKATTETTCFECSSDKDNNNDCKRPADNSGDSCKISITEKCTDLVLLGRKSQCFIHYDGETVSRGCASKKPTTGVTDISEGIDSNSKCIADAQCYICDSSKDDKCTDASSLGQYAKTCNAYTTSCYLCEKLDGTKTTRGCGLNTESDVVCQSCYDENCNKAAKLPKSCYTCDSKTNPKCASNEDIETKFCKDDTDECYALLDSDGLTKRGCKSELSEDSCKDNDSNCKTCKTHNCNTEKFVTTPRQCYVCNDNDDCAKDQNEVSRNATACAKSDDLCYLYSSDDKIMTRGCMSDADHPTECDQSGSLKCLKCAFDGCNSKALLAPSGLKCVQCKQDDETCSWRFEANQATACAKAIPYYRPELCYVLDDGTGQVERGCYSESTCTLENPNCRFCYDDGCNTQSSQRWSCVRCRSTFGGQSTCKKEKPEGFENTCVKVPTAENRGCYVYNYDGVIIRGCLSDLEEVDYANCVNDKYKQCSICKEENCNTGKAPNKSSTLYVSTALVFSSLIFIFIKL